MTLNPDCQYQYEVYAEFGERYLGVRRLYPNQAQAMRGSRPGGYYVLIFIGE